MKKVTGIKSNRSSSADQNQTKLCPFCAEEIKEAAIKCKHCKTMLSDIENPADSPLEEKEPDSGAYRVAMILWILAGTGALITGKIPYFVALYSYALFSWAENAFYKEPSKATFYKYRPLFVISTFLTFGALISLAIINWINGDYQMAVIWVAGFIVSLARYADLIGKMTGKVGIK